tara:strand:- start:2133 stop:2318 length:186 start_codon:yes stop_codon:yes gene_type:complete
MPNSRHQDKKGICIYEWECNLDLLKKQAAKEGLTLATLIKKLTRHHLEKTNPKAKIRKDLI